MYFYIIFYERSASTIMELQLLEKNLYKKNKSELRYLETHTLSKSYESMKFKMINQQKVYIFDGYIPKNDDFTIQKHNRFAPVPTHIHNFIEINYIFNGQCTQIIDGREVLLTKGQICLIDTDVPHSIKETGEQDIIINILIHKNYFKNQLLSNSLNKGIITDFIMNVISETANHRQYIIFKNRDFEKIHSTICDMLLESYSPNIGDKQVISHYLSIFFIKLLRDFDYETNGQTSRKEQEILEILKYLETNYESLDLSLLAKKFNYTPNYLSTLLKKKIGKSYSEIILEKKLDRAHALLQHSDLTINDVAIAAGFTNPTFFYNKYKEKFNKLPSER